MSAVRVRARRWVAPNGARLSLGHSTYRSGGEPDGWYLTVRHAASGVVTSSTWLRGLDSRDPAARHAALGELTAALAAVDAVPYIGPPDPQPANQSDLEGTTNP